MVQEVMNLEEVAQFLKVSTRTILREIKGGRLKAFRVSHALRFRRADVEAYMQAQLVQPESIGEKETEDAA